MTIRTGDKRICVFVDRLGIDGQRCRRVFWEQIFPLSSYTEVSVSEEVAKNTTVRISDYDLVVVNYDCANGDHSTGSNETLEYFETRRRDKVALFLKKGGVLLCEHQSAATVPFQMAYDAIFGKDEISVFDDISENRENTFGPTVRLVSQFKRHPLLSGVGSEVSTRHENDRKLIFYIYPQASIRAPFFLEEHRDKFLWHGWFKWWRKGWVPLLEAKLPDQHPFHERRFASPPVVLLAKYENGGILIASTIWISGAVFYELMKNVITAAPEQVRVFHQRVRIRRFLGDVVYAGFTAGITALILFLFYRLVSRFGATEELLFSISGVGVAPISVWIWTWYYRRIWKRPYGFSFKHSFFSHLPWK